MQITNNTLIISMTSWPRRIQYVSKVLFSLLSQNIEKNKYHLVLVLAEPEFPNKEKDLPDDLKLFIDNDLVELIWYKRNIFSHKKLMPVLQKYPNNPILVTDDDICRKTDWLSSFIEMHAKHPNDIITGLYCYTYEIKNGKIIQTKIFNRFYDYTNNGKLINFARPANGAGGTLYPPRTFTDKRFFDEDLYMRVSPTSDEMWQWCFNVIENKNIFKATCEIPINWVSGSQKVGLYKINSDKKYEDIFNNICKAIPEFKTALLKRLSNV